MPLCRLILALPFLLFFLRVDAQNFIANSSFQDLNVCSELDAPCSPSAWKTTSPHLMMYGAEKNGNYYARLTVFNSSIEGVRKYMQTRLLCPLQKDQVYILSLRLKPEKVFMSSFGVHFSPVPVYSNNDLLVRVRPTVDLTPHYKKVPYNLRSEWFTISTEFRATGDEKFLILGNFQDDSEQERTYLAKPRNFTDYEYHFDDVELRPKTAQQPCRISEKIRQQLYSQTERHPQKKFPVFSEDEPGVIAVIPAEDVDTLRLGNVYFEFDSDRINSEGKRKLDSLFRNMIREDIDSIRICGHTDSMGPRDYNINLSMRRAEAINGVLEGNGLSSYVTGVKGYGDLMPVAENTSEAGRKKNRRVEVIIFYRSGR